MKTKTMCVIQNDQKWGAFPMLAVSFLVTLEHIRRSSWLVWTRTIS
jgi:hypothetical protein